MALEHQPRGANNRVLVSPAGGSTYAKRHTARHDLPPTGKIPRYLQFSPLDPLMEAERINALSALIDDLRARVTELRRYL